MDDDAWAAGVAVAIINWVHDDEPDPDPVASLERMLAAAGAKIVPAEATKEMIRSARHAYSNIALKSWGEVIDSAVAASPPLARGKPQEARDE